MPPNDAPGILFTAFEPSGDALAAPVIARLRAALPERPIWALGGPKMRDAGAELIESTTDEAAMLAGSLAHVLEHRRRVKRLRTWLADQRVAVHVPVDSPAANWSICKLIRRFQPSAGIAHLAAPQLWAWAPWRIRKLRRLTDHVLCLLPFEPDWFSKRGVRATFVGHPIFDREPQGDSATDAPHDEPPLHPPEGAMKLALLPGSRRAELRANWPTMVDAFAQLRREHTGLCAWVAAADDRVAQWVADDLRMRNLGDDVIVVRCGQTDACLRWCDVALVVSGTATLQVASHGTPMVALFNTGWWSWQLVGRWLVKTRTFTLPNLIAEAAGRGRVIDELVPHFGAVDPVVQAADRLLADPTARAAQADVLREVTEPFRGRDYAHAAAEHIAALAPKA